MNDALAKAVDALIKAEGLSVSFRASLEAIHAPLAARIVERRRALERPALIGLSGPQGSGKSTAALALQLLLSDQGLKSAALSLDDFYLTRAERGELAARVHPLFITRGVPGTHDRALMVSVIGRLLARESVALPRFDKAQDDRAPEETWPLIEGPVDVVLLEGWCVGARSEPEAALAAPINALEREEDPGGVWRAHVNATLALYQPLFEALDLLIVLEPPSFETVALWRKQQEEKLRTKTPDGAHIMSEVQLKRFMAHYERLTRHMLKDLPTRADIRVTLDAARNLTAMHVRE